jgi:SIR2-like domain
VLETLQARIDQTNGDCRFRKALAAVVALANPSEAERAGIDYARPPSQWPEFDTLAGRLVSNYARMLNVTVDGEETDYLLWDVLDAAHLYSDPTVEPDAEHLCLAALAIEGVASELPSANWDPLVERAVVLLAGNQPVLRVVVAPDDARQNRRRANLYKFHGCAQAACDNPEQFRGRLVARQSQINGWVARNPVIGSILTSLIVTRPTIMLGLSTQDSNIQGLFVEAKEQMAWRWPSHPPAYVFSENALGGDQGSLLENVYHLDYTAANRPLMEAEALVQAYAKPLLIALFLYVLTSKLKMLVGHGVPGLAAADRDKLHNGLVHARNFIADALAPTADVVTELLQHFGRTTSMLREGTLPNPVKGLYTPISPDPLDRIPADPTLAGSGVCQFAIAAGLIGLGLERGLWTGRKAEIADDASGALVLVAVCQDSRLRNQVVGCLPA